MKRRTILSVRDELWSWRIRDPLVPLSVHSSWLDRGGDKAWRRLLGRFVQNGSSDSTYASAALCNPQFERWPRRTSLLVA